MTPTPTHRAILQVVARIPRGRVSTYGWVAALAGYAGQPRLTGYALRRASDGIPWHRVVNARGEISPRAQAGAGARQRTKLRAEGVRFTAAGRIDLARYGWRGGRSAASD